MMSAQLFWQSDNETSICMLCAIPFTLTRRRHHCRMCGKIFCSYCSQHRIPITFLNNMIARVCLLCYKKAYLKNLKITRDRELFSIGSSTESLHPIIGCEKFPSIIISSLNGDKLIKGNLKVNEILDLLMHDELSSPVSFALNYNLVVMVKLIKISKFMDQSFWLFVTNGLTVVGQDEIVTVLERHPMEPFPRDLLLHFNRIYKEASFGYYQHHLSISDLSSDVDRKHFFLYLEVLKLFKRNLNLHDHNHSLHPFHEIWKKFPFVPRKNFLLSILLNSDEHKMASLIPTRVMIRMASDQGYYPYPLISKRWRNSYYFPSAHSVLDEFHENSQNTEHIIGLKITIKRHSHIYVEIPKDGYNKLMRCLNQYSRRIVLLGDFDENSCACLACNQDGTSLTTSTVSCSGANNIMINDSKGASFLIVRGTSTSFKCLFEIVEDGAVVDIGTECFNGLISSFRMMRDYHIEGTHVSDTNAIVIDKNGEPDNLRQSFSTTWTDEPERVNIDVASEIDGRLMEGIRSLRLPVAAEERGVRFLERENSSYLSMVDSGAPTVRWLEVFFIELKIPDVLEDSFNMMNFIRKVGLISCKVLQNHASLLEQNFSRLGLRLSVKDGCKIIIESGSSLRQIPSPCHEDIEDLLLQTVTEYMAGFQVTPISIVVEFVFQVLSLASTMKNCPDLVLSKGIS